MIYSLHFSL